MNTKFNWPVRVYYEDTDAEGVVYYANYLRYFERARTEWLRACGIDLAQLARSDGVVFAVAEAQVRYAQPARLNDLLEVSAHVYDVRAAQMRFAQTATLAGAAGVACEADFRVACVAHEGFRPRRIPLWVLEKIQCAMT